MGIRHFILNAWRYTSAVRRGQSETAESRVLSARMAVFVINLERKPERRAFAIGHLKSHGLTPVIWPAVDARGLDLAELQRSGIYDDRVAHEKFSRSLSLPEIGCSLSHVRLYEHIVRADIPMSLVLEDDAMLVDDFTANLEALLGAVPESWDLVQLIYACKDYEQMNDHAVSFKMQTSLPAASAGYVVTRRGAEKLLSQAYPIHYPADSFIGRSPRWGLQVYGAMPQLVTINNLFPSDIAAIQSPKARAVKAVKDLVVKMLR